MADAARFCEGLLVEDADGLLVTSPSTSPEHKFRLPDGRTAAVSAGAAMDLGLVWDVLSNVLQSAALLGIDDALTARLRTRATGCVRIASTRIPRCRSTGTWARRQACSRCWCRSMPGASTCCRPCRRRGRRAGCAGSASAAGSTSN